MRFLVTLLCLAGAAAASAPFDSAQGQQTLTVLSSNATKAVIEELAPHFETASRQKLTLKFENSAALRARIEQGERFDVVVMTASAIASLDATGKLAKLAPTDVARAGIGIAIHPQATTPDLSSLDALKGALLVANSITYVEQGATTPVMRAIFARLGLAELMSAKTVYADSAAHAVAEKKAELGFTQISEILNVPGAVLAGPLPPEVQVYTTFQAATSADAPPAARQFIAFITGPQAAPVIRAKGMELITADRLPPVPDVQLTAAQREAIEAYKLARGVDVSGPFHPLLRSPELMIRTRAVGDYLRYKSALPPRLSEFVILMTAREWTQQYEWNAHYPIALKAGLTTGIANAIADGRRPAQMSDDEAILYDFCRELHRDKTVSDATYSKALQAFGEQGVIDTLGISGYYTMLAMVLNTARTPARDTGSPVLRPLPQ